MDKYYIEPGSDALHGPNGVADVMEAGTAVKIATAQNAVDYLYAPIIDSVKADIFKLTKFEQEIVDAFRADNAATGTYHEIRLPACGGW